MAHGEWVGNLGYVAFSTEDVFGTPSATPGVFTLIDEESLNTDAGLEDQEPIFGNPAQTFQVLPGLRDHKGDLSMVAEPNTAAHAFDMLLTHGSVTGSGPYTHPFTLDGYTLPHSKTVDISTGNVVKRFVGVQASKIAMSQSKNQIMLKVSVSALGSFEGANITSVTGSGPYTVVLDATYDPNVTGKLLVGDLIRFYKPGTAPVDATIATIVNGTTITTTTDVTAFSTGGIMHLRPQTPSFALLTPFLWSNTQFCFGATASAALSAAQTRLEQGSTWELDYGFESDSGSQRSGSADPASLVRMLGKANLDVKKFYDTPDDNMNSNNLKKTSCVIRHFAYSGSNTYELRVTINHLVTPNPMPAIKAAAVNYSSLKYSTQYDTSDSQMFDAKVINGLETIA